MSTAAADAVAEASSAQLEQQHYDMLHVGMT